VGTPRGLGLATATTSAPFFPHLEHRIRSASSLRVIDTADQARQCLRLDVTRGAAHAAHAHQEFTKAIVELLDVSEHAHPRMVRRAGPVRPCSSGERSELYRQSVRAGAEADIDERKMMGSRRSFSSGPRMTLSDPLQTP
jgi:hypothetical protein